MNTQRRNILMALGLLAAILIGVNALVISGTFSSYALSSPFAATPTTTKAHVQVSTVAVFGDSLVFGATGDLQMQLAGYQNPEIHGVIGTSTVQLQPLITEVHQTRHPDAMVIALGTNDLIPVFLAQNPNEHALHMINLSNHQQAVLQTLNDTPCVIWVGVQEHNTERNLKVLGPEMNATIRANVANYPNAHFLDWEAAMSGHTDWQAADGLHFSPAGNAGYATAITQVIASQC